MVSVKLFRKSFNLEKSTLQGALAIFGWDILVHPTRLELAQLKSPLPPQGSVSTKFHHGCNYSYYSIFAAKMGKLTLRPRIRARLRPRIRARLHTAIHLRLRF